MPTQEFYDLTTHRYRTSMQGEEHLPPTFPVICLEMDSLQQLLLGCSQGKESAGSYAELYMVHEWQLSKSCCII
jgi:hypothetical protein